MATKVSKRLKDYVKVYKNFLSEEDCYYSVKQLQKLDWQIHTFYNPSDGSYNSYDDELSISNQEFPNKQMITERIWHKIGEYVSTLKFPWFSGWNGYTVPRFNKYDVSTKMKLHCDHIHSMFDGQRKGVPVLTILGSLNNDYEGGELVMWDDTVLELKAGELMIFPSNFLYPHEIKPVKSGVRYSYVSWTW